jgi:hypothetical protein
MDRLIGFPAPLKTIYSAVNSQEAEQNLIAFAEKWDQQYPMISKSWLNHWERITPFLAFPEDIRRAIYTTNAIESVNMSLRKVLRNHRSFPTDESAMKLIYLAINNISKKWTMPIHNWKAALSGVGDTPPPLDLRLNLKAGYLCNFQITDTEYLTISISTSTQWTITLCFCYDVVIIKEGSVSDRQH